MLAGLGFEVSEHSFSYSALPGRWATPLMGATAVATVLAAGHVGARGHGARALTILVAAAVLLAAGGQWLARRGVLRLPLQRRRGVNLWGERGAPRVWLVAHLDSKSQPVPIVVRAAGIAATCVVWLAAVGLALAQMAGVSVDALWTPVAVASIVAGLPVLASTVGDRSPGALDNASGVAAVLAAAELLPRDLPLGVVLTTAEELGLAGVRAWAAGRPPAIALNCDGVDDTGALLVMYSGAPPARVLGALTRGADHHGAAIRVSYLLPGVLTDAVALTDAGWEAATLSRGSLRTIARIHTPADARDALSGDGAALAARLLASAATELA